MVKNTDNVSVDIEKMLGELRVAYIAELPSRLEEIEQIVLGLKKTESFTEDYQNIYRHIHSIKGSAGTHGLYIISSVCHVLEDKVIEVEGNQELISDQFIEEVLGFIDLLRTTLDLVNSKVEDFAEVEAELERLSGKGSKYEYTILLIMASVLHRKMIASAFEKYSVKFRYETNGYEALGLILKEPFDILITNMEVSDLQGLPLISALRMTHNRNKDIPSILLTSGKLHTYGRSIDPDYVIKKDAELMENLQIAADNIIRELNEKRES